MDRTKEYHDKMCQLFPEREDRIHAAIAVMNEDMGMTVVAVYAPGLNDAVVKAVHFALDNDAMVESLVQLGPKVS